MVSAFPECNGALKIRVLGGIGIVLAGGNCFVVSMVTVLWFPW